jgi:hypothetical protein
MKNRTRAGIIALSAPAILYLIKKRGGTKKISGAIRRGTLAARNAEIVRLGARVGATYATASARKVFSSAERRIEIDHETELKTAAQVSERLGNMKGALMKLGQMASYLDDGLPAPMRAALSQLQASAPPMSSDLAAEVIERELGASPDKVFVEWDPVPIASASIGQVHRAVMIDPTTGKERAVAVKVQYPGVDQAIDADLRNADFLGALLQQGFSGLDPSDMVQEVKERIREELDYSREAKNQQLFADYYRGHPYISVPEVMPTMSTSRVLTTELVNGMSFAELMQQDQEQKNLTGECLFRFVFGLVKHFSDSEMNTFISMVKSAAYESDIPTFRAVLENAGMLQRDAPVETADVGTYFGRFYEPVRKDEEITWTPEYSKGIVRHTFDRSSPIAQYATVPKPFVFIQRINLGLYAILGELGASGNYRRISQEIWPFANGAPSTEMGRREAQWLAQHG